MKYLKNLPLILGLIALDFFLIFYLPKEVFSQPTSPVQCNMTVNPVTGASNNLFWVSLTNCIDTSRGSILIDGSMLIQVRDSNGDVIDGYGFNIWVENGTATFPVSGIQQTGQFTVMALWAYEIVNTTTFQITEIRAPVCCTFDNPDPNNCPNSVVGANSLDCPADCPSNRFFYNGSELWFCYHPITQCSGTITGNSGMCYFLQCPTGMFFDGINQPLSSLVNNTDCPLLYACCTTLISQGRVRPQLIPQTVRNGVTCIETAIGCIPVSNRISFLSVVLPWALGVGGGMSFILMVTAGYLIMTSSGDPYRAKAGKELLGSAIAGLLMIIFSVYLLDVIGLKILRIPGI